VSSLGKELLLFQCAWVCASLRSLRRFHSRLKKTLGQALATAGHTTLKAPLLGPVTAYNLELGNRHKTGILDIWASLQACSPPKKGRVRQLHAF
jgi:hypothetical protein